MKRQRVLKTKVKAQPIIKKTARGLNKSIAMPTYSASEKRTKIAIVQTGSWGDNINSTLMLPPLKEKFPNSIIDIHTSTFYANAFNNNPYIDNIIKHSADNKQDALHLTLTIPSIIEQSGYDHVFSPHPMFNQGNWTSINHPELGTNLICAWIRALEHADIPYTLPLSTIMQLAPYEIEKVSTFCKKINLKKSNVRKNIMEVHGESGQTFWDNTWTDAVVTKLCDRGEIVFISHRAPMVSLAKKYPNLCFNVNHLSIRECAELYNRCDRFFSVSSGLSNACNTNWCRTDVEWIEVINSDSVSSAPIRSAGKTFWYKNNLQEFLSTI